MLRAEMTEEQREEARRKDRVRRKLRNLGRPGLVPIGPARKRLKLLRDTGGQPFEEIGRQCDLNGTTLSDIYRGRRANGHVIELIPRTTQDKIMSVPPPVYDHSSAVLVSPVGTIRRLQALVVGGYSARYIALACGHKASNMFNRLMLEIPTPAHYGEHVTIKTRERVRVVYEKLAGTDPLDNGMTKRNVVMARRWAAEHGWAPHWAWDDDTIEDPAAHPEWTGACGTRAGFRIHIRELMRGNDLPLCLACRVVFEDHRLGSERWRFNNQRFSDLLDAQPGSIKAFARALNLSGDRQVHAWRTGKQAPVYWSVIEDLAEELNCGMDDLVMEVTWEPLKKPRPIIPGDFNPYVVRVALDYGRTSQSKAADICNVSRDTMNNWLFARGCKPSSKEKLVPLAQHLGIDVEVFYP